MIPKRKEKDLPPLPPPSLAKLLLVEGPTPLHFFEAMAAKLGKSSEIEIRSFGGIQELQRALKAISSSQEFQDHVRCLGICRDAEQGSPESAREAVLGAIQRVQGSLTRLDQPPAILILPSDESGNLETVILRSLRDLQEFDCVADFFQCARAKLGDAAQAPAPKNELQAWLALQANPQYFPGIAAEKKQFDLDHPAFREIRDFLASL